MPATIPIERPRRPAGDRPAGRLHARRRARGRRRRRGRAARQCADPPVRRMSSSPRTGTRRATPRSPRPTRRRPSRPSGSPTATRPCGPTIACRGRAGAALHPGARRPTRPFSSCARACTRASIPIRPSSRPTAGRPPASPPCSTPAASGGSSPAGSRPTSASPISALDAREAGLRRLRHRGRLPGDRRRRLASDGLGADGGGRGPAHLVAGDPGVGGALSSSESKTFNRLRRFFRACFDGRPTLADPGANRVLSASCDGFSGRPSAHGRARRRLQRALLRVGRTPRPRSARPMRKAPPPQAGVAPTPSGRGADPKSMPTGYKASPLAVFNLFKGLRTNPGVFATTGVTMPFPVNSQLRRPSLTTPRPSASRLRRPNPHGRMEFCLTQQFFHKLYNNRNLASPTPLASAVDRARPPLTLRPRGRSRLTRG